MGKLNARKVAAWPKMNHAKPQMVMASTSLYPPLENLFGSCDFQSTVVVQK